MFFLGGGILVISNLTSYDANVWNIYIFIFGPNDPPSCSNILRPTATSALYPTRLYPTLLYSLPWDKLRDHSGGAAQLLCSGRKFAPPRLNGLRPVFSLLYLAHVLMVGSYANSSKLSYTTTLSYTTDTFLNGLGETPGSLMGCCAPPPFWQDISSTKVNRPLVCCVFYCIRPAP